MSDKKVKSMGDHLRDALSSLLDAETSAKKAAIEAMSGSKLAGLKKVLDNSSKYVKDAVPKAKDYGEKAWSVINPPTLQPVETLLDYDSMVADGLAIGELPVLEAVRTIDMMVHTLAIPNYLVALGAASIYETRIYPALDEEFMERYAVTLCLLFQDIIAGGGVNEDTFNGYIAALEQIIPETPDE